MVFRVFAIPHGPPVELRLPPRLESWNRYDDPAQVALREFGAHVRELIDPVIAATAGDLAFRLDVGLPDDVDPLWERDLDNYLFPIARTLPRRVVSVWGTKTRSPTSRVRIERAVETPGPVDSPQFEVPRGSGAERLWKAAVRTSAARCSELPPGPVALQLSIALGPGRSWANMWKPSIDGLEPVLGRTYADRHWNPLDGRIVRLGLHRHVNHGLGHDAAMAVWACPADETWPELRWLAAMTNDERAAFMEQHLGKRPRARMAESATRTPPPTSEARRSPPSLSRRSVIFAGALAADVKLFKDDDAGYLQWLATHQQAYVVNIQRSFNPSDARIHRADCRAISGVNPRRGPWTGPYVKFCSPTLDALDALASERFGGAITRCGRCHPPAAPEADDG